MSRTPLVEAAHGDRPLDLVIRGGELLNVYTGELYPADIGVFGDRSQRDLRARVVLASGQVVARDGVLTAFFADPLPPPLTNTVHIQPLAPDTFHLRRPGANRPHTLATIDIDANRTTRLGQATLHFKAEYCALPLPEDMLLLSVVPRHSQPHPPSLALLRGWGCAMARWRLRWRTTVTT